MYGRMKPQTAVSVGALSVLWSFTGHSMAQGSRLLDRADYESRVRAMWLGEVIADWTGLPIENAYYQPPFLTDENWGMPLSGGRRLDFVFQDPWRSDDDTDIEYVYMHLLEQNGGALLSSGDIVHGWMRHINHDIWNSNRNARTLMDQGIEPPGTSLGACNLLRMLISCQLTIEMFGAVNPGMPERALEAANLPIRTAAFGYAAHACQFYVVLYSLATQTPQGLSEPEKLLWLVRQARRYIPNTSKAADAVDFVVAHYLATPDPNDWESTRDAIYDRYQLRAAENGFHYWGWSDSTLNFANGIMALLFGQGSCARTIQIGTLAGWDCENQGCTMAGLLGLMHGYESIAAEFPGQVISDRYTIRATRDNLPDYLPADPEAEDTFKMIAVRMAGVTERAISDAGGLVSAEGAWLLPPALARNDMTPGSAVLSNPGVRDWMRSITIGVRAAGGTVTASTTAGPSNPPHVYPYTFGVNSIGVIANGNEEDYSGVETDDNQRVFYSSQKSGASPGSRVTFTVSYNREAPLTAIRLIEGNHFHDPDLDGGWLTAIKPELRVGGRWIEARAERIVNPPDPAKPFQFVEWVLPYSVHATGVRITGTVGGRDAFATVAELDALAPPIPAPMPPSFDINADGWINPLDVAAFLAAPQDLNGDGVADDADRRYLELAAHWRTTASHR